MNSRTMSSGTYGAKRGVGETKALVLRYLKQGLSIREIAQLCGISTQAVHQHIRRLRAEGALEREVS